MLGPKHTRVMTFLFQGYLSLYQLRDLSTWHMPFPIDCPLEFELSLYL